MAVELSHTVTGAGPPLVVLHGLFGSKRNWAGINRVLAARHRVVAADLPATRGERRRRSLVDGPDILVRTAALAPKIGQSQSFEAFMPARSRPVDVGIVFPDHRDVIADDVRRFRRLSPLERWREIFALRQWGDRLAARPSRGASIRQLQADDEARWQAIQRDLFARHGG